MTSTVGERPRVDVVQDRLAIALARAQLRRRERAAAALGDDVTVALEIAIGTRDRVGVDVEPRGEIVDRRQLLVLREPTGGQGLHDRLVDLAVHRQAAVVVELHLERQGTFTIWLVKASCKPAPAATGP